MEKKYILTIGYKSIILGGRKMKIVAGCIIKKDNKILMVKEGQKICYGQWNFPAGSVDELETILDAAIRETYEETGCKVKLTGVLPISTIKKLNGESVFHVRFIADIIEENIKVDGEEILNVKWLDIDEIKNMANDKLRASDINLNFIKNMEEGKVFPLDVFDMNTYIR